MSVDIGNIKEGLISVIVPVYNTAEYLENCLNSIIGQTYKELEIICVNDGSTDASLNILRGMAKNDSRIVVADRKNSGVSAARNHGIGLAHGEYIGFIDSDDYIDEHYFEELLAAIRKDNADIAVCNTKTTELTNDSSDYSQGLDTELLSVEGLLRLGSIYKRNVSSRLFSRRIIRDISFLEGVRYGEDVAFNLCVLYGTRDIRISHLKKQLHFYYKRADSVCNSIEEITRFFSEYEAFDKLYLSTDNEELRSRCIREVFNIFLSTRLWQGRSLQYKAHRMEIVSAAKEYIKRMRNDKGTSASMKIAYSVFVNVPFAFKMYYFRKNKGVKERYKEYAERIRTDKI